MAVQRSSSVLRCRIIPEERYVGMNNDLTGVIHLREIKELGLRSELLLTDGFF